MGRFDLQGVESAADGGDVCCPRSARIAGPIVLMRF